MRHWTVLAGLGLALLPGMLAACGGEEGQPATEANQQPYAGWESRPIAALAPETVEDLLAGRGAGYALAAELNHYPGPTHVLAMATQLQLTAQQEASIGEIKQRMQEEAQALGKQLVDLEAELDDAFSTGAIKPERLRELTSAIAAVEGTLRSVHLAAHLEVKALLSEEQVRQYDTLRGYTGGADGEHAGHQSH